jgi:D-glycero-alpha-D-manno-heptose 1-phosphate guanylyltransferase
MNRVSTPLAADRSRCGDDAASQGMKAVLLVGGMGTRLRSVVPTKPKPLASVGSYSLLQLLIRQLRHQGIRRLVLCTGYLAEQIENEFGDGRDLGLTIEYSREPHPLGTGGAVKLAQQYLQGMSEFLVMNGDSFLEIDFCRMLEFHRAHAGLVSMAVLHVQNSDRYGTVGVDSNGRVIKFAEKTENNSPGLINAGVYVFDRGVFEHIPDGPASLERDVFPQLLSRGIHVIEQHGIFIDIGTPEDYARAQSISDRLYQAAFWDESPEPDQEGCQGLKARRVNEGQRRH